MDETRKCQGTPCYQNDLMKDDDDDIYIYIYIYMYI